MSGYLEHFGLDTLPFATAPDPRFAFATRAHEIELLRMQDSVQQRLGLCLLRGEIGTGKSTIAHMLMKAWGADERYVAAYIPDPLRPVTAPVPPSSGLCFWSGGKPICRTEQI